MTLIQLQRSVATTAVTAATAAVDNAAAWCGQHISHYNNQSHGQMRQRLSSRLLAKGSVGVFCVQIKGWEHVYCSRTQRLREGYNKMQTESTRGRL